MWQLVPGGRIRRNLGLYPQTRTNQRPLHTDSSSVKNPERRTPQMLAVAASVLYTPPSPGIPGRITTAQVRVLTVDANIPYELKAKLQGYVAVLLSQ